MANDFYTRTFNPLPGQRVDEQVLKDEFQLIEQGFDEVESDADTLAARAIKIPESSPDQTLVQTAVQRAGLVLAFDGSGNVTAISYGRWRDDWLTATAYVISDHFRDAATGNLYAVVKNHTSGVFATDLAAGKFELMVDVATLTAASAAAVAAAATATTQAGIATTGASTAITQAGIATAAAVSAAASFDTFDDIFLGAKAADPTTDNDGNALQTGALYFNTTAAPKEMRVYDGSAWAAAYLPAAGYATLNGVQTLTNKTLSGLSNAITNVASTRITRDARTSNTMLVAADNGKVIDVTSGTFTQTADTPGNLGANWQVLFENSGTGVVTFSGLALVQGAMVMLHSDGTTVRTYPQRLPEQITIVRDEKTSGTAGGTPGSGGSWLTRTLTTTPVNSIVGASLASNEITLPAGTYLIEGSAPAYKADSHKARLYNVTAASTALVGTVERSISAESQQTRSSIRGIVTLASTSALRVEHMVGTATANGFGVAYGGTGIAEVYTELTIRKLA